MPSPGGTLTQAQRTVPPVESLSLRTVRIKVAIRHALGRAGHGAGRSRGWSRGGQRRGGGSVAWRGVAWRALGGCGHWAVSGVSWQRGSDVARLTLAGAGSALG